MSKKMFGDMMKQAMQMQERMKKIQEEVGAKTVEASAGGGVVTVAANGKQEIISIKIDPSVINLNDADMLQDLILAAVNEALRKSKDMMSEEMKQLTMGINIPGLF
ncbi:MAG: nucleoid-associated protein, YbaB/EbfC family [Nitrospirae bacterium RBG_19FT_COMBO_42_15]|nr:MAG: nucleoid-associated protein, YbaB/EbfC family [Nitrospirae bacterium RBG_19FT_COMBO_42_15]